MTFKHLALYPNKGKLKLNHVPIWFKQTWFKKQFDGLRLSASLLKYRLADVI